MMNVAIVGSREFGNDREVEQRVREYIKQLPPDTVIISGGARGVDTWAEHAADDYGLETLILPANWNAYGKAAGMIRNKEIVANCDRLVAFWDGSSKGTKHSIEQARIAGKLVEVITI